ncbi:MAG TPA: hypothetical protein VH280_24855 [Verrucomicrobiae bacterium]|jgi:hypothetical protein|nr:hypothetical protein [Verrucomicrobiae bacterium]
MKLGKLLAAGKSIMNGHADVSYRSRKQVYLPKFGSDKNPFKPESSAPAEPGPTATGVVKTEPEETKAPIQGWVLPPDEPASSAEAAQPRALSVIEPQAAANEFVIQGVRPHPGPLPLERGNNRPVACDGERVRQIVSAAASAPESIKPAVDSRSNPQSAEAPKKPKSETSKFNPLSILQAVLPGRKAARGENTAKGYKGMATQTELSLDSVKVVHNDLSDVDVEVVPIKSRAGTPELPAPRKSWEFVGERLFGVEAT